MAQSAGQVERSSDRWISVVLSVLLHGTLVVAVAYGWWSYRRDRPTPTLAIDATVVDVRSVPGLGNQPPQPQAPPPPPPEQPPETQPQVEPEGPPEPTPDELAKREQERQQQAEQEAQAKQQAEAQKRLEQERQQEAALAQEKADEEKRVEERRLAEEQQHKLAAEKAEAERKEREAAEAKKRAEEKRLADEKKQAEERAKEEAEAKAEREADLKRSLDQELRQEAAINSGALATWESQIVARIQDAWNKPDSVRPGLVCELDVTQAPGGVVTNVRIGACNGDQAVRDSIESAAYRASPLPPPPDPSLFQRELLLTFRPH
jgi:colicin import membrane protein